MIEADVFRKFTNNDGNFKESLDGDVLGLLSLYEATYLMTHREELLDEALTFTNHHHSS